MNAEDAEEYTQSLEQVFTGSWRQIALGDRLGVPDALGLSTRDWVEQRLGGYIKLAREERRAAVKELTEDGMSQREISAIIGVDQKTVSNVLNDEEKSSKQDKTNGKKAGNEEKSSPKRSPEEIKAAQEQQQRLTVFRALIEAIEGLATLALTHANLAQLLQTHPEDFAKVNPLGAEYVADRAANAQAGFTVLTGLISQIDWKELQ
jgi:transposase